MGNVIAEYSDYALAYQLIGDAFRESLGEGLRYAYDRMWLIEKESGLDEGTSKLFAGGS